VSDPVRVEVWGGRSVVGGRRCAGPPLLPFLAFGRRRGRTGGDYHLTAGSPCIDAGTNGVVQPDWTDMDGQPRSIDDPWVNLPGRGPVDIGADEYARGDLDFDGDVDVDDYGFLAECFTGPLVPDPADQDGDGDVDLDDFVAWAGCHRRPESVVIQPV